MANLQDLQVMSPKRTNALEDDVTDDERIIAETSSAGPEGEQIISKATGSETKNKKMHLHILFQRPPVQEKAIYR